MFPPHLIIHLVIVLPADLLEHLVSIWSEAASAEDEVEGAFVDDLFVGALFLLEGADVHLL